MFAGAATFSMYALAALLPLLPAKQRVTHPHDWMTTDTDIACPDPNCGARFRITRTARRSFRHSEVTAVPLPRGGAMTRATLASGYDISRVLKGGLAAGGRSRCRRPAAALADMDRFVEAGITTFDCADIYTGVEELIGRWLRTRPAAAAAVQVHTKYVPDLDRLATHSRADVVRGIDRSLQRLGVDALDLVQLHWWDYDVPGYVDAARWLDELRAAGKIRHVGLTNFDRQRLAEIVGAGVPVVSHQVQYLVLDRRPLRNGARLCVRSRSGCSATARSPEGSCRSAGWTPRAGGALENRSLVKYRLIIDEFGGWDLFQRLLRVLHEIGGASRRRHWRRRDALGSRSAGGGRHHRRSEACGTSVVDRRCARISS